MSIAQEALRDALVTTLVLMSPVIVYISVFCIRYFVRWLKGRRSASCDG